MRRPGSQDQDRRRSRIRILYHHRTQLEDAQGVHIRAMVAAFRELGHEVEVVSLAGSSLGLALLRSGWLRVDTARLPRAVYEALSLGYNVYGYRELARAIRRQRPDLIYERYAPNTCCGVLAGRRFGIPVLLEINAPWHEHLPSGEAPRFQRLARRLERWVCSTSTSTIAVSVALKRHLVESGVPERQVTVIHNATDPAQFHPGVSGAEVRARYRLDGVVAGFVGWLREWHGLEGLIKTVHDAGLLERGLRLLIVGAGPAFARVQARVRSAGLADRVIMTGPVAHEAVPAHIAALDIALQPRATAHACPMKLIEYMAMARCIVAPDQPNIRELLRDGASARLFRPEDERSLARSISDLMISPAERKRLGRNAHQWTVDHALVWRASASRALGLLSLGKGDDELKASMAASRGAAAGSFETRSPG